MHDKRMLPCLEPVSDLVAQVLIFWAIPEMRSETQQQRRSPLACCLLFWHAKTAPKEAHTALFVHRSGMAC